MEDSRTRPSNTGVCVLIGAVYLAARILMPMLKLGRVNPYLLITLALASIMFMMFLQLGLVASISRLQLRAKRSALWLGLGVVVFVGLLALLNAKLPIPPALLLTLASVQQLALILLAVFAGVTISHIIREKNLIVPVAIVAALVDFWNVYIGPLGHIVENKPHIVAAVAVHMPSVSPQIPMPMIGMGDFVFLSLYFSVVYRFGMNARGMFWWGYALLTVTILAVLTFAGAIPALVPMAVAVVAANHREFRLAKQELLATITVSAIILVLLGASAAYTLLHRPAGPAKTDVGPGVHAPTTDKVTPDQTH